MIDRIKQFFSAHIDPSHNPGDEEYALRLATAALLIEASRADFSVSSAEQQTIVALLRCKFGLAEDELQTLVALAEQEVQQSVSLYQFTRLINDHYSAAQKVRLVRSLWEVAYADGDLDKYEDHFIRTLADLIHVPHADFIRTKLRVQEGLSSR